jgi:hypothetical protein
MRRIRVFLALMFSALVVAFAACTCGPPSGEGEGEADAGPVPAVDAAYSGAYDEAELLRLEQEEGFPDLLFPRNQLLVRTAEATTRDELLTLLDDLGGRLIGQIPPLGVYQVELETTTLEELREVRTRLLEREEVESSTLNFVLHQAGSFEMDTCPVNPDNRKLYDDSERADPMDALSGLYAAIEIVSGLWGATPMVPMTMAMIELGFQDSAGEFDDTPTRVLQEGMVNNDHHGNAMVGLVCADNDGAGVNGIASALLRDRLDVILSRPRGDDIFSWTLAMFEVRGHADIVVNAFYAAIDTRREAELADEFAEGQLMAELAIEGNPQTWFVNAAPNVAYRLTSTNVFPVLSARHNVLTVGATVATEARRAPGTAFGDRIDISAPGAGFYVLTSTPGRVNLVEKEHWTSLATAQVASAVAMLQSMGGYMTRADLERYLLEYVGGDGFDGPVEVADEGGVLLSYSRSLNDLLWDRHQEREWAFILDGDENNIVDPPTSVALQLCVDSNFRVESVGDFAISPDADCGGREQAIMLSEDGSFMAASLIGYDDVNQRWGSLALSPVAPRPGLFAVDTPFSLGAEAVEFALTFAAFTDRDEDCGADFSQPGDMEADGLAIAGVLELTNCRILERAANGEPKYLLIDLAVDGVLDVGMEKYPDVAELFSTTMQGWVRGIVVQPLPPSGTFVPYIDDMCSD